MVYYFKIEYNNLLHNNDYVIYCSEESESICRADSESHAQLLVDALNFYSTKN